MIVECVLCIVVVVVMVTLDVAIGGEVDNKVCSVG